MALRASPTWAERKFMRNLRFKKGAVVKFCGVGFKPCWGKVVDMTDTEVKVCYQQQVSTSGDYTLEDLPYDQKCITADTPYFTTIDKDKISQWEFFHFTYQNSSINTCFCKSAEEFNALHINHYKNGICTGEDEDGGSCSSKISKVDGAFAGDFEDSFF